MSGSLIRRAILLFGLIGFTASAPGIAQTTEASAEASTGLQEIVVPATRREERLQDVPISVSSFSQEQLDAQGLRNIDDLTRLSPGVTFLRTGVGSSGNFNDESTDISIRGIDSSAGTSTTAVYIDDTPIQSDRKSTRLNSSH